MVGKAGVTALFGAVMLAVTLPTLQADQIIPRRGTGSATTQSYRRADAEKIARGLYLATLGREADAPGLSQAIAEIQRGNLTAQITSMTRSPEFRQRVATLRPAEILEQFYQALLNRTPDTAGVNSYMARVERGQHANVLVDMVNSPEYRATLSAAPSTSGAGAGSSALDCQMNVVAAVRRQVGNFVYLSFDRGPDINGNVVSGPAVDRLEGNRGMTYRCEGSRAEFRYDDNNPPSGSGDRQASAAVRTCLDAVRTRVTNERGRNASVDFAFVLQSGSNEIVHGVGQANGAFEYTCEMDQQRVVSSSYRMR